ncbi:hypothetical protein R3P38DRAFT_2808222 [Favolaschia claudopus]|uniref:Uncharacterized protein n=1 Tax=Favolaschia claudopus TaxID=2862362 RepID=A0AAV9Z9A8_9AGAR
MPAPTPLLFVLETRCIALHLCFNVNNNKRPDTHRSWDACTTSTLPKPRLVNTSTSATSTSSSTIPVVEPDEENEDGDHTRLLEDGLGHDDDDEENGEDDPDPNSLPEQGNTKPSRPICPLPEWLEQMHLSA